MGPVQTRLLSLWDLEGLSSARDEDPTHGWSDHGREIPDQDHHPDGRLPDRDTHDRCVRGADGRWYDDYLERRRLEDDRDRDGGA